MNRILPVLLLVLAAGSCGPEPAEKGPGAAPGGGAGEGGVGGRPAGPSPVLTYDLHGVAGFFKVHIFAGPDMDSPRLGYLRKGQRVRVGDPRYASEGCPEGWYQLPGGGFVCRGRGMLVGKTPPFLAKLPPEARVDELEPYPHGFIRSDWTPAYRWMPGPEEMWQPPVEGAEAVQAEGAGAPEPEAAEPAPEADADAGPAVIPHSKDGADGGVDYYRYAKQRFKAVRTLLSKGFWISFAERRQDEATSLYYYETVRNDFVPADAVHPVKPPEVQGYAVLGTSPLPAAIVNDRHAAFYTGDRGRFHRAGPAERLQSYRVYEARRSGKALFYRIGANRWLNSAETAFFELRPPPPGVGPRDKWIRVDLGRQTLEAYEGPAPVYVTLISSGLPDSEETVTPTGRFSIQAKHLTDDMTGSVGDAEVYSVEDVPWVQYLHLSVALHSSFWHASYGTPKSHGCINLSPADARWLFRWTDPPLPEKWHGVIATEKNPGTLVIIEGKTPGAEKPAGPAPRR